MIQQTLEPILGATGAIVVQFFVVLILVLVLMTLVIWLVRFVGGGGIGAGFKRQRAPRLGLVDALPIDQKRRLILVRRDQFEHLLLIGGPTDVVVEQTIFRGVPLNARLRPEPVRMPGAPPSPQPPAAAVSAMARPAPDMPPAPARDVFSHSGPAERDDWPPPVARLSDRLTLAEPAVGMRRSQPTSLGQPPAAPDHLAAAEPLDLPPAHVELARAEDEAAAIVMAAEASIARMSEGGGESLASVVHAGTSNANHGARTSGDRVANLESEMARLLGEISGKKT